MRFEAKRTADDGTVVETLRLKNIFHWNFLRPTIDAYATSLAVFFSLYHRFRANRGFIRGWKGGREGG